MHYTLFHGSDHIIEKPVYDGGKPYNDYGKGFYCTESLDMAKEWAVSKDRNGYASKYFFDSEGLAILNLNSTDYTILHWLAILLENRKFAINAPLALQARDYILTNFLIDYQNYDCIIGYRADDSYFSFAQDFISGAISYRQLSNAMYLGELGQQFVLKSQEAFNRIVFDDYYIAKESVWYARRVKRDKTARTQYLDKERYALIPGDIFITQILTEEMKANDPRLR